MRPWERAWFTYWRTRNPRLRKDRQLHKIERALIIWPLHLYARWKTRKTPKGVFFNAGKEGA